LREATHRRAHRHLLVGDDDPPRVEGCRAVRRIAIALMTAALVAGCGTSTDSSSTDKPSKASANADAVATAKPKAKAAARRQAARDRARTKKLTAWFRKQKMTPSDLYAAGIDAPESMMKVYSITLLLLAEGRVAVVRQRSDEGIALHLVRIAATAFRP
jgi:hypothetical protein